MDDFITFDAAQSARTSEIRDWWNFINPPHVMHFSLFDFDRRYVKADGASLWDDEGNEYVDFTSCYGALNLGHNHPKVAEAVTKKIAEEPKFIQATLNPYAGALAKNLASIAPGELEVSFFCCSGADAVEAALKTARAATKRPAFVYAENSFHGKTFGALSVTGREKYRKPFEPLMPNCREVPYGDAEALDQELSKSDVAAFIVEPIQGEGGVIVPPDGYLKEAERICRKYGTLLIVDEIQTGVGRTGKFFACEHENVEPDIITLAKSLGGGYMPLGCAMYKRRIWESVYGSISNSLLHTSTLQNISISCAAGLAALEAIYEENLLEEADEKGRHIMKRLKELEEKHPMIKEVRGKGLMIGVEFYEPASGWLDKLSGGLINKVSKEYFAQMVMVELLHEHRIIALYTLNNPNVIRVQPPLVASREQLDRFADALDEICEKYKSFWKMSLKAGKTALGSIFKR